jgi:hypothetical protein
MKQPISVDTNNLLTVSFVARELETSEQNVRRMSNRGVLTCTRLSNGARVFRREDVAQFAAESRPRR